tara:strand:- start:77 stop:973 length:897 start_codon:yes stop_codon:yes gene_type:complete
MGTPDFAVPILKSLSESEHNLLCVYTQPPKKKARGQKILSSPIYEYAKKLKISTRCPTKLNDDSEYNFIKKTNPNIVIVVAYGQIIPKKFLDLPNVIFLNIHASILPKWRGAAPIQRAIMNLDKESGISIMKIVSKLDAGPVMMKSKVDISKETNYMDLSKKLSNLGAKLILKSLNLIQNQKANFINQDEKEASYAKKIDKKESKLVWTTPAKNIVAKINALYPNPGTWLDYRGSRIKIIKAIEVKINGEPGQILDKNFTIACSKNAIQILELQKEGKKKMKTSEYLKGHDLVVGAKI